MHGMHFLKCLKKKSFSNSILIMRYHRIILAERLFDIYLGFLKNKSERGFHDEMTLFP